MAAIGPGNRLPPDWNYAVTRDGRVFFINEIQRETTWLHPLTGQAVQTGYERVKGLPMGWEHGLTQDGDLYFINHNEHITTFEHPVTGNVSNKKLTFRDYGYPAPTSPEEKQIKRNVKHRNVKVQVPAAKRNPNAIVIKRGWLHRYESSGIGKKTWRKRWCVLAEYALFFYKDESENQTLASILLPSYRINNCDSSDVINKAFAFKIEHENTKTCYLAADSIDDLNSWLRSVQEAATLKDSPQFHRETNNNLTNFSKLNNMKLIPKSPIIVSHDDSDDEIPFYEKLSEWEKSWKSPGPSRKHGDPYRDDGRGRHDPYESDGYGDYPILQHGDPRNAHNNHQHNNPQPDPRSMHKDDPRSRYSNSQNSDENSPRGLQRWHNENLGSGTNLRPDILEVERDLRHQSMASDRSDPRDFDNNPFNPDSANAAVHRNSYDPKGISYNSLKDSSPMSREQLQRMSYDGAYSPKRAENQRDMSNQKDFPGRFINTAYHPSLQNLPGPASHKVPNDRIFPEFQDRTQSQPNLTGTIGPPSDHHRFGPPKPPERGSSFNHKINPHNPNNQGTPETSRIQGRPPVAAPRSQIPNQNKPQHLQEPHTQRGRDSYASSRPRDSYSGSAEQRNSFQGPQERRNNTQGDQRGSYVGPPDQRDSYQGSVGQRNSFHGAPDPRNNDTRHSYAGSQREPKHLQDPRERNSYHSNPRDSYPGNPRDSYPGGNQRNSYPGNPPDSYPGGNQRDGYPGNPRDSYPGGNQRDSYPGNPKDSYQGDPYQRNSYSRNQGDSYPGNPNNQHYEKHQIQPEHHHPVAAPRKSLSPDRNPGLTIDIPPNYINLPPGSHPTQNASENGPNRPPYPSSLRQQMIEDLAKDKTPKTSQQYLTSAENEKRRMEQSSYFQYPTDNQQQSGPRVQGQQTRGRDGWEDNSARELRAAYERVQQLQNSQKSSDPNSLYGTVNKKNKPNKNQFSMHTVKEDPNMSDRDILTTTEIKNLNKKYPLNGSRIRMSISANDLIGKNHDELVLLLIQLRRNQSALEKAKEFYKQHLDIRKPSEKEYRKQKQDSPGYMDRMLEEEHNNYRELKHQLDEIDNKLEVYRPIINLVDNMVTMGSLYGGDNLMLATQYRRHLLHPDQYTEAKDMIDFSRRRQEKKMVQEIEDEIKNLTDEEVDLEDKLDRLYELDRRLQEQSFLVTSFSEDKEMLEKALQGIIKQQDQKRDDPREMRALMHQQRTIEKELSRVTQQLAEASRLLEETTAENNKIEHEVALLRTKVHGDLQRSKSAPSLVGDNEKTKRKMEKELAKVQTMISGLNKEGERLQQAMSTIRRSSSGTQLAALLDKDEDKPLKKSSTYMQTDLDSMETIDLAKPPRSSMSMPDISSLYIDSAANDSPTSNYTVMSSPKRSVLPDESEYVAFNPSGQEQMRSKSLNELNKEPPPPPPPRAFKQPLISHQRQQSSVAPPSEMYNSNHGDVDDDMWDIGDADDNTKRFYGLIPREKPKAITVRDVKRQAEQRRERGRRGDEFTDDESTRWSLAEGDEPIGISHVRYPSDSTGSLLSGPAHENINGYSQPLYENLPRAKSVPSVFDSASSSRRSSLVLFAPKPFTPYQGRPSSALSSEQSQSNQEVELPSFMQKKVSTLSSSKPYNSEMNIPTYQKDGLSNESNSWKIQNNNSERQSLPWLKSGSQLMSGVLNVNKNPGGRYTTITSSQPSKLEVVEPVSNLPLQANMSSHSAEDSLTNRSIDEVPDVVKSSTNLVNKIDEYSIDDILRGPEKVLIPERYIPDEEEEIISEDEMIKRQEKAEKFKKILAQQSIHSYSQPDISRDNLDAHEKARQDQEMRSELLGVGQELARQVTQKSKRDAKAAAERRKTWSGGQFAEAMSQVNRNMADLSRTQDTDFNYITYQQRENIYI